jgi:hypothetical protein
MRSFIIPRSFSSFEIGASRSLVESQGGRVLWTDRKAGTVVTCPDHVADLLSLVPRGNPSTSGRKISMYEVEIETVGHQKDGVVASLQHLMDQSAEDTEGELSF